jgi:D-alanyl-D-alanine dipeptidase
MAQTLLSPIKLKLNPIIFIWLICWTGVGHAIELPHGFVYLDKVIPSIRLDMRYASSHNFIGEPIDGYLQPRAILARQAAAALNEVQQELARFGLGLKVFDAYRPQRAVDHFIRWAKDLDDVRMKKEFYPQVDKSRLFTEGYIAMRSGHSRGSTVDLTLISLDSTAPEEIDMGGAYDFFGIESWPTSLSPTANQRAHRLLLSLLMEKHGFAPYPQEWWHFTLKNEPYPDTYFDFPVQ